MMMFRTYLKIAFRNFVKDKFFSVINVAGLAVGIAVVLVIALYMHHEISYDRFHSKADRIYRIGSHLEMGGSITDFTTTFGPLGKAIKADIPEVREIVRLYSQNDRIFKQEQKVFAEDDVLFADPSFFKVFDFKVVAGDTSSALRKPNQVLLTPHLSQKYFPDEDAATVIGKSIFIDEALYEITGVVDEAPANSHVHYSAVASLESLPVGRNEQWNSLNLSLYLLLDAGAEIERVEAKIAGVLHKNGFGKNPERTMVLESIVHNLKDIHLHSNLRGEFEPGGNITTLYVFGSVAVTVLFLACVNFINLVTARSANRAKEVGVRKVLGSTARQLMAQFILESIILVFFATLLSLGIVELLRGPFTELSGKELSFEMLQNPIYFFSLFLFVIVLGILAGSYPAFFLASFKPAQVLKGKVRSGFRSSSLRNILVTMQFVISMVLIICAMVVNHQLDYMQSKKLGFDKENILVIENADKLSGKEAFINSLKLISSVNTVATAKSKPLGNYEGIAITTEPGKENQKLVNFSEIDYNFLPVLKYEFVSGRNFSEMLASDSDAVVLNERAARYLFDGSPEGKKIFFDGSQEFTVVGVVKDFNFESLKNDVRPVVFFFSKKGQFLHVRLNPGNYKEAIRAIERLWKQHDPSVPFSYAFLDEDYNNLFSEEVKLSRLSGIFTGLALFIACLGLLGLAAYSAEQRQKEISVRKILGATFSQIIVLMSRDFAKLIVIAFVLAAPFAYFVMQHWLDGFAYRVNIPVAMLFLSGAAVLIVALLAVSYQAVRSALANPVDSLKEE
jgi:putative ABC transport system permease protein